MPMRDLWQMWEASIPHSVIDLLEIEGSEQARLNTQVGVVSDHEQLDSLRHGDYRDASKIPGIQNLILEYVNQANENAFRFDIEKLGTITYTNYGKYPDLGGNAKHWHMDTTFHHNLRYTRKLTVHIQMSDSDESVGGDFLFKWAEQPDPVALRKKGTVLIFPSYLEHKITKVTQGQYRNITAFVLGSHWV